jgi:hypothetical protein
MATIFMNNYIFQEVKENYIVTYWKLKIWFVKTGTISW